MAKTSPKAKRTPPVCLSDHRQLRGATSRARRRLPSGPQIRPKPPETVGKSALPLLHSQPMDRDRLRSQSSQMILHLKAGSLELYFPFRLIQSERLHLRRSRVVRIVGSSRSGFCRGCVQRAALRAPPPSGRTLSLRSSLRAFQVSDSSRQGKLGSPSGKLPRSPWEWVAPAHPPGKHVPHPAGNPSTQELQNVQSHTSHRPHRSQR